MGFDTAYFTDDDRRALVLESLRENRIILTRDSRISRFSGIGMVHIKSDFVEEQARQVMDELGIKPDRAAFFTICVLCNCPLVKIDKEKVKGRVPEYTYKTQEDFMECGVCGRTYWQGTHWTNVEKFVEKLGTMEA